MQFMEDLRIERFGTLKGWFHLKKGRGKPDPHGSGDKSEGLERTLHHGWPEG